MTRTAHQRALAPRPTAGEINDAEHALRVFLRALSTARPLWDGLYIDLAKVEAAKLEAGLVDSDGRLTEFGKRHMPSEKED